MTTKAIICRNCNQPIEEELILDMDATGTSGIHATCPEDGEKEEPVDREPIYLHGDLRDYVHAISVAATMAREIAQVERDARGNVVSIYVEPVRWESL